MTRKKKTSDLISKRAKLEAATEKLQDIEKNASNDQHHYADRRFASPLEYSFSEFNILVFWFFVMKNKNKNIIILAALIFLILSFFFYLLQSSRSQSQSQPFLKRQKAESWVRAMEKWDKHRLIFKKGESTLKALAPANSYHNDGRILTERVLVLYTYAHETWRCENLKFFLTHGIIAKTIENISIDYVFVVNGDASQLLEQLELRNLRYTYESLNDDESFFHSDDSLRSNVPLIHVVKRENTGFDFCAWKLILQRGLVPRPGLYVRIITMNGSVRGPFMVPALRSLLTWVDIFIQPLRNKVKLVGTTVNCVPLLRTADGVFAGLHLQSMVLGWHMDGLKASAWTFQCLDRMIEVVSHCEVGATQSLLEAGFAAVALQKSFYGFELSSSSLASPELARRCAAVSDEEAGDPSFPGVYASSDIHPYETIFIKTNRQLLPDGISRLTYLHNSFSTETVNNEI